MAVPALAPSRAYQVALMCSSPRACSVGARLSAEQGVSRLGPSIAPLGRTVRRQRTPSATSRSYVHSSHGEGGGDDRCAHKEEGAEGVQRDLDPTALEHDPHAAEEQDTGRAHGQQDVIVRVLVCPVGMTVSCVRAETDVRRPRRAAPRSGLRQKPACTSEIPRFT
jgi:hypothetical protein